METQYRTFLDVLNLLKKYDIYIHVGTRLWDIELATIEIDNLYRAGILDVQTFAQIKQVLRLEHENEERQHS